MKAEIEKGRLILIPETRKEITKLKNWLKSNSAEAIIPKSRKKKCYWRIVDVWLDIKLW